MTYPGPNYPNFPPSGQPPSFAYPPAKKPVPVVPVILAILGLLMVLAVVGGIKAFHAVKNGSSEAIAIGDRFVDAMGRHQFAQARSLFTPDVQARTPASSLQSMEALTEKGHGTYVAHGQPQWNIQNWNGQTSVRLTYPAQFTKSGSTVSLTLVQTGGGYRVYEAHYEF